MIAPDRGIRDRIVAARGVNLAVEAGAGTGKTTLLVRRVLSLVEGGTPLARLAIITFTRKAAAELESRLVGALAEARAGGAAWAAAALDDLPRTELGTTDSFCRGILADHALEAGFPPGFGLAAELAEDALREAAWLRFLARSGEADARLLETLRALGAKPRSLREIGDALLDGRDLPVARGTPVPAGELAETFAAALAPALALRARCTDPGDRLALRVDELARNLDVARDIGGPAAERVLLSVPCACRQGRKEAWGGAAVKAEIVAALDGLQARVDAWTRAQGAARAGALADWLAGYPAEYARIKRERGLADFRDLALGVRDLLRSDAAARRAIAARWDALLIDEAQDTDPLQMEIALLLAAEEPVPDDPFAARLVPGRLFLVGDPKQSIYRFRRADLELYARTRDAVTAHGESPAITANFRCARPVLDFVNRVFDGWMEPAPGETLQAPYRALEPGRDGPEDAAPVALLLPDPRVEAAILARGGAARAGADERLEVEADAVVRTIRRALGADGAGPGWTVAGEDGRARPARPGDIAVIVKRMTGGERLLDALRRAGIPVTSMGGRNFHAREEVQTLLAVLEALIAPDDPRALFAALRSPAFAIDDDALVLRFADPEADPRNAGVPPEAIDAEARLRALAREVRALPLGELLERVTEALALLPAFGLRGDGPARMESLRLLVEASAPLEEAGAESLPELVAWLRDRSADEPLALGEIELAGDDAVTLLTIHKAKGLEFPVVLLADLGGKGASPSPVVWDRGAGRLEFRVPGVPHIATPGHADAAAREARRRAAEDLRLLYVAMTRARDRLVLAWTGGADGFFAKPMLPARLGAAAGEPPPEGSGLEVLRAADLPPLPSAARVHALDPKDVAARRAPRPADLFAAPPAPAPAARERTVTSLAGTAAPAPARVALAADAAERERSRAFGSFVHAALEVFDPSLPGAEGTERAWSSALRRVPPPDADTEAGWRGRIERMLADPGVRALAVPGRGRKLREVPFTMMTGGGPLHGTIDLLEELDDGALRIVDWKTDRLEATDAGSAAHRHLPQIALYARAATQLTGRPVREVVLVLLDASPVRVLTFPVDAALTALADDALARA